MTTSSKGSSHNFTYSVENSGSKYGGLITEAPHKRYFRKLQNLLNYMDSMLPPLIEMHIVISILRIVQLFGLVTCTNIRRLFNSDSTIFKFFNYLSIVWNVIPIEYRDQSSFYIALIYFLLNFAFFMTINISSRIYQNNGTVPRPLMYLIHFYVSIVGYLIHVPCLEIAFETFGLVVTNNTTSFSLPLNIVGLILSVISFLFYYFFIRQVYSFTFVFRPTSLLCVHGMQQMGTFMVPAVTAGLVGFCSFLPKILQIIDLIVSAFLAASSYFTIYRTFSLISSFHSTAILTFSTYAPICFILYAILLGLDQKIPPAGIFVWIGGLVVDFVICHFITQRRIKKALEFLDRALDDPSVLDAEQNDSKLLVNQLIGFQFAHPVALEFTIFKVLTDREPYSAKYWCTYGKFVAIYPELMELHNIIVKNIVQKKIHGIAAKQCIMTSNLIFQQRESNLTPDLKKKLAKVARTVASAKRKLRHIWDQVIQGNLAEMDGAIANAYKGVEECESEFNLLLMQLPNNRFLYRSYATYLFEVGNDFEKYKEISDQTRLLSRGIRVMPDHTQDLGLLAFPNLPQILATATGLGTKVASEVSESFVFAETDLDDETITKKVEDNRQIMEMINTLKIPSLKTTIIIMGIITLVTCILGIICNSIRPIQNKHLYDILEYSLAASFIRHHAGLATSLSHLFILTKLGLMPNPNYTMKILGNEQDIQGMVKYSLSQIISHTRTLQDFRGKYMGNYYMDYTRMLLYDPTINMTFFYPDMRRQDHTMTSTYEGLQKMIIRLTEIADLNPNNITNFTLMTPSMRDPFVNIFDIVNQLAFATMNITGFMEERIENMDNIMKWTMIGGSLFFVLLFVVVLLIIWKKIAKDKITVYKTLLNLPKNVVSQVSESLRLVKDGSNTATDHSTNLMSTAKFNLDLERNRQEENLLKVLNAASDESAHQSELSIMSTILFFYFVYCIVCCVMLSLMYVSQGNQFNKDAQHSDNLMTISAFMSILTMQLNDIAGIFNLGVITDDLNLAKKFAFVDILRDNISDYYTALRFGYGKGAPYPDFTYLTNQSLVAAGCNKTKIPDNYSVAFACMTPDSIIRYAYTFVSSLIDNSVVSKVRNKGTFPVDPVRLPIANHLIQFRVIDDFLYPGTQIIGQLVKKGEKDAIKTYMAINILCIILIIFCFIAIVRITVLIERKLKFTLKLLLFCQAQLVLQNSFIVSVLNGNFGNGSEDTLTRDNDFYDTLVEEMPDAIVVTHGQQYTVTKMNKAANNLFKEDLMGQVFSNFIQSSAFKTETTQKLQKLFDAQTKSANCSVQYKNGDPDKEFLSISKIATLNNETTVFTIRNTTQMYLYNKLILEERAKSDKLLSSILPASLVPRVQAGESNISFSVPSATVCFIDIVEFTPWCGSNSAQVVTGTLNMIFSEFDTIVASLPFMERVKCIGDCYMCAGGVFAESPNVLQFARSTVDFGLQAIEAIGRVNEAANQNLKVRVGIHIGGPIVAGVIGIGKPTFEIFGPAISYAQQMEHNGVPMKVHISRAVYELIYGGNYKIEERGEIQIKQGKVVTYLVSL